MSSRAAFLKSLRAFLGILGGAPPAFAFASPRGLGCAPSRAWVSHFALKLTIILLLFFSCAEDPTGFRQGEDEMLSRTVLL
jgi:hypothetical protein